MSHRKTARDRVWNYVSKRVTPATRSEISKALDMPYPATCRRVDELLIEGRLITTLERRGQASTVATA